MRTTFSATESTVGTDRSNLRGDEHVTRRLWILVAAAALLVAACTSGDSSDSGDDAEAGGATTQATTPAPTGPSPGVTDTSVKVGVTYVDASALQAVGLNYDLGDVEGAYQALFDSINADGGINGRT